MKKFMLYIYYTERAIYPSIECIYHTNTFIYLVFQAKIKDFDAVEAWAPSYEKIQYENILVGTALRDWLHSLQTK